MFNIVFTWAFKPAEWRMFVATISEGSDSPKRTIAQTWSCGEVSLRKKTLLLQEGLVWRYTWKTSSLPEHLLRHEEKPAGPVCLALSLFDLTLLSQETKPFVMCSHIDFLLSTLLWISQNLGQTSRWVLNYSSQDLVSAGKAFVFELRVCLSRDGLFPSGSGVVWTQR